MRLGLAGVDGSHAEDFLRHFNLEQRYRDIEVTTIWGGDDDRLLALREFAPVEIAGSLSALIANVDGVIIGDRDGRLHRAHAIAAISAGRPVFVDKPLANDLADATAIVDAAEAAGLPLLSGSALRWQPATKLLQAKLAGLDEPIALEAHGTWYPHNAYSGAIFYAIHTIELVQQLIGIDWRKLGRLESNNTALRFRSGPHVATIEFRVPEEGQSSDFGVTVRAGKIGFAQSIPLGDDYMRPVCDQIAHMLRTGHSPLTRDELLAPIRLMEEIDALLAAEA